MPRIRITAIRITEQSPVTVRFEDDEGTERALGELAHVLGDQNIDWEKTAETCRSDNGGLVVEFVAS